MKQLARGAAGAAIIVLTAALLSGCALANLASGTLHAQRVAAADATVKSQLAEDQIAAASYAVDNNGSYEGMTVESLTAAGLAASDVPVDFGVMVNAAGTSYCLQGTSKLGKTLHVTGSDAFVVGECPTN